MTEDADALVEGAFGERNRKRLIEAYYAGPGARADPAWKHVYRLLLWTDRTTGLAHCYESDKCQPGKPWYARSLAFHDHVSRELSVPPKELGTEIDWMFRKATLELAKEAAARTARLAATAQRQQQPYSGRDFPRPGDDPELVEILRRALGTSLAGEPSDATWGGAIARAREHFMLENKRKNLLGEGFEDVLGDVLKRTAGARGWDVKVRSLLREVPGFLRERQGAKPNKVDVALVKGQRRILVTVKWSVRADREKQFAADFNDYALADAENRPWEYVFVTNEFDPARLKRACDALVANNYLFSKVVHINEGALKATYGADPDGSMRSVLDHLENGRLVGLDGWIASLA